MVYVVIAAVVALGLIILYKSVKEDIPVAEEVSGIYDAAAKEVNLLKTEIKDNLPTVE